jgi:hypothetical protein
MSNGTFDFNLFIKESKDVLVNPKSYFSTMRTSGGMTEPLIKAVIYGAIAGVIGFIWSLLKIGVVTGGMFGGALGIAAFIWSIIGAIIGLFIGGVILLVISSICKGNTDFEACLRVAASVMVVMPISALLGFTTGINSVFGAIVALGVNLYGLYLLYYGLTEALKANPGTAKIITYVLAAIMVIFMIAGLGASRRMNKYMNDYSKDDLKEMMKDQE